MYVSPILVHKSPSLRWVLPVSCHTGGLVMGVACRGEKTSRLKVIVVEGEEITPYDYNNSVTIIERRNTVHKIYYLQIPNI